MGGPDPFEAMTVREAARCAGVPASEIRSRIDSGALLHERARRGGRDVLLVRRMDLACCWPSVLPELGSGPRADLSDPGRAAPGAGGASGAPHAVSQDTFESGSGAQRPPRAGNPSEGPFEVQLASMQVSNAALQAKVEDLEGQRQDLKDQRLELSERMAFVEQERQASTAALLRVQGRLLELEAARPARDASAWWRRQGTWGLAGFAFLVLGGWGWQGSVVRAAQDEAQRLSGTLQDELAAQDAERATWIRTSSELAAEMQAERSSWDADRQAMIASLDQRTIDLEDELVAGAQARLQFESTLNGVIREAATMRVLEREQQAARVASLTSDREAALEVLARERDSLELERDSFQALLAEQTSSALHAQEALLAQVEAAHEKAAKAEEGRRMQAEQAQVRADRLDGALSRVIALEERLRLEEARALVARVLGTLWR